MVYLSSQHCDPPGGAQLCPWGRHVGAEADTDPRAHVHPPDLRVPCTPLSPALVGMARMAPCAPTAPSFLFQHHTTQDTTLTQESAPSAGPPGGAARPNLSNVLRKQSNKTRNQTKQKKTKFLSPALLLPLWIPLLQCPDLNESQVCFKNPFALPNPNPDPSSLYRHRWSFAE
jgi:hypothetical protein